MDRTHEFNKYAAEARRNAGTQEAAQNRAEFPRESHLTQLTNKISQSLSTAEDRLRHLSKLSKQSALFNDKPTMVQNLGFEIKNTITEAETAMEELKTEIESVGPHGQGTTHFANIHGALKNRLLNLTLGLKHALEVRTQTLKRQGERRNIYTSPVIGTDSNFEPHHEIDMEGGQRAQLTHRGGTYSHYRAESVENVQKVIGELGAIFQKVTSMVVSQDEQIRRIDDDLGNTSVNLRQGQAELLRYFSRISSNRTMILKVFGILIAFIVFFVLFLT